MLNCPYCNKPLNMVVENLKTSTLYKFSEKRGLYFNVGEINSEYALLCNRCRKELPELLVETILEKFFVN